MASVKSGKYLGNLILHVCQGDRPSLLPVPSCVCYYSHDASPVSWICLSANKTVRFEPINELRDVRTNTGELLSEFSKGKGRVRAYQDPQHVQFGKRQSKWAK